MDRWQPVYKKSIVCLGEESIIFGEQWRRELHAVEEILIRRFEQH